MNRKEYEEYRRGRVQPAVITAVEMGGEGRTLTLGYTVDREDMHVYLLGGEIHVLVFDDVRSRRRIDYHSGPELPASWLRPSKRAYPDATDRRFAERMRELDSELCFLGNFNFDCAQANVRATLGPLKAPTHLEI